MVVATLAGAGDGMLQYAGGGEGGEDPALTDLAEADVDLAELVPEVEHRAEALPVESEARDRVTLRALQLRPRSGSPIRARPRR